MGVYHNCSFSSFCSGVFVRLKQAAQVIEIVHLMTVQAGISTRLTQKKQQHAKHSYYR